ncbi:4-methyl-5(B-hydroxyethyl)-thiazole monophosphate biosynthesis protein [Streptococcus sp. HMSC067H01]|uniref:DJ-1 family glyoxalase III n=1 Tax=Streptococcus sp. HMSC067H01 TaxID=1739491 RepID=UPI0008BB3FDA|nr:DJ-1 family glyoxalase III [Streptococcus sp. HMSC067H01]OFP46811.1 4-methyl-5(B-hydroxyethyl)-thiazole monophosphate biosynthesis protein [Streptococcus sp. HMSC067H01]
MAKVAVILADGFEEIEALTVVDVLRRANITCHMVGFEAQVTGSHAIQVQADRVFDGDLSDYDMIVLPGGMPGSAHLRDNEQLIAELQKCEQVGKKIAAICAAPIVLNRAGLLKDKEFTCYDGVQEQIADGHYRKETVVVDGQLTTSRGPATALAFAYNLVEQLGGDANGLREAMLYRDIFGLD